MIVQVEDRPIPAARKLLRELTRGSATPQRLRRVGAVLVVGCLLTGLVGLVSGLSRADSASDGATRIAALTADAAGLYHALADADAMATGGYVSGGVEPAAVRARYDADIAEVTERLVQAAGRLPEGDPAQAALSTISAQLPTYTSMIETARVYNRQNLPLGQSYLASASRLMRTTILPAADELRATETTALDEAFGNAGRVPWAVLLVGLAALVGIVEVGLRERRRTNRVFNVGLLAAGAALVVLLAWWAVATAVAGSGIGGAARHSTAADALDDARAAVLQARSNESLVLVARSGGSDSGFTTLIEKVPGLLDTAAGAGAEVESIRTAADQWETAHVALRALDDGGKFREAAASATGADPQGSGVAFERLDRELGAAVDAERAAFADDAGTARGWLPALAPASAVLGLLAAAGVIAGIGRRLGEYR